MKSSEKILLEPFQGKKPKRLPFWFMRQAGRYLPEYRQLRAENRNFLDFCYTPDAAVEATLQPIRRFGMSAAIIFSDILVVPHALGVDVRFEENIGPVLAPVQNVKELAGLSMKGMSGRLDPVYQAIKKTRLALPKDTALIGFAGAPWTLACYVTQGGAGKDFSKVKALAAQDPVFFSRLIDLFTQAVIEHCDQQVRAGADVIQIFDSWAGVLDPQSYDKWVMEPTRTIVHTLKLRCPATHVIGFPRQSGAKFLPYIKKTCVDAISFDGSVPVEWAKSSLQPHCVVQGCLDPELLAGDRKLMLAEARRIIEVLSDKPFVFNLSHGILPHTPVDNMQALCDFLKKQ